MEQTSIEYKGMTNLPSDYLCEDGDMLEAVNAEWRDGSYHAARIPKGMTFHVDGFRPRFLHEPSDGKKYYIGVKRNEEGTKWVLAAYTDDGSEVTVENAPSSESDEAFGNFCALGNVVCLTFDKTICCILYDDESFNYLGDIPSLPDFQFYAMRRFEPDVALHSKLDDGNTWASPGDEYVNKCIAPVDAKGLWTGAFSSTELADLVNLTELQGIYKHYRSEEVKKKEDAVFGAYNNAKKYLNKNGYLTNAVMIRYAYRLYDGHTIMPSNPILVFPPDIKPQLFFKNWSKHDRDTDKSDETLAVFFEAYRLFAALDDDRIKDILKWNNVIKSVDFFISDEIHNIESDALDYTYLDGSKLVEGVSFSTSAITRFKDRDYEREILNANSFYLISSFDINDLYKRFHDYTVTYKCNEFNRIFPDDLTSYTEHERLEDSLYSNSSILAQHAFVYNSRLVTASIKRNLSTDWNLNSIIFVNETARPMQTPFYMVGNQHDTSDKTLLVYKYKDASVRDMKDVITKSKRESFVFDDVVDASDIILEAITDGQKQHFTMGRSYIAIPKFIFLPDISFSGIIVKTYEVDEASNTEGFVYKRRELKKDYSSKWSYNLDGAFEKTGTPNDIKGRAYVTHNNLVKFSEVNDPFFFKDGNSCECGRGSVIAIATSATPTSQGQFGQYPLFAFCTDGVYAIGIGTDGTIQNCSPFSTDIISGPEALVNVGRDIVFATRNGVFSIGENGRTMLMQVDNVDRHTFPDEIGNVRLNEWFDATLADHNIIRPSWEPLNAFMASNVKMAYDYQNNRIILYSPDVNYCYLMDAASKRWSVLPKTFSCNLNPVARCLMVEPDMEIVTDYSTDIVLPAHSAYWVTRPFKLGDLNAFKTIRSIIQRGVFKDAGKVQQALFGSNDLQHWVPVRSSNSPKLRNLMGSGYKYFRLAVFFKDMEQDENIAGASIGFDVRINNKIR